ncbi:hypothetical protein K8U61_21970 [Nocardioides sp. GBK3QG-3]|uniref:Uncharacterized protein n=1 Tax=Nocardioides mangrovi TaxID=2874580 RepID=A0ABS7UIJ1_9ACTN|nr:hypothetical protein [Nocardioides mangrovi]
MSIGSWVGWTVGVGSGGAAAASYPTVSGSATLNGSVLPPLESQNAAVPSSSM